MDGKKRAEVQIFNLHFGFRVQLIHISSGSFGSRLLGGELVPEQFLWRVRVFQPTNHCFEPSLSPFP